MIPTVNSLLHTILIHLSKYMYDRHGVKVHSAIYGDSGVVFMIDNKKYKLTLGRLD